jgi:hypothetical protein
VEQVNRRKQHRHAQCDRCGKKAVYPPLCGKCRTATRCVVCGEAGRGPGWCDRCKELSALLTEIHR